MSPVRVIENTEYCQQRLGFLKYLVWRCASLGASNLMTIGKDLINTVTTKVALPVSDDLLEYIKTKKNYYLYRDIEKKLNKEKGTVRLEIQDAYLSDRSSPSGTGKLLAYAWEKYPYLSISLGLVRKTSYSITSKGQLLLQLTNKNELQAFKEYLPQVNPLIIDEKQKLLFLFLLLENDGDVVKLLFEKALELKEVTNRSLGDHLSDIYLRLIKTATNNIKSGDDLEKIQRLSDKAKILEQWKGKPDTGSRTARNKAIIVRIEPYVDLGLVEKKTPFGFQYKISTEGSIFFSKFVKSTNIHNFLFNEFFQTCNLAYRFEAKHFKKPEDIYEVFLESYNVLKSPLGYAPIEELILLAGIKSITEKKIYFEIKDGIEVMESLQKDKPYLINFNIDRTGNLTYVRFTDGFISFIKSKV